MSDVTLVVPPYGSLAAPSLSLGLLKVYLNEAGIETKVVYANLPWAEEIGLDNYRLSDGTMPQHLVGEWTFSGVAFPDFEPDYEEYFKLIGRNATGAWFRMLYELHPAATMVPVLQEVRRRASGFIDDMARRILADGPRIVGCTSMFQQHCASLALLRRIRELDPDVVTMMGGANCEGPMAKAASESFPWVDFVASGEADGFIADLCRDILERGRDIPAADLPEAVYGPAAGRNGSEVAAAELAPASGSLVVLGAAKSPRAIVHHLDETAIPDYDDYFEALYSSPLEQYIEPTLMIETSRGCWWGEKHHCTFCGINGAGMVYRSKSPERALNEIDYLTERYGVRKLEAADAILDMSYLDTVLAELAKRDEPPALFYEVKANLKREHVERFSEAGLRTIQPGIESLHGETLKLMDKGNSGAINVQLLKWVTELGIGVNWNFIVNIPGERDEWYAEMAEWMPLVEHLTPPTGFVGLRFDRFSPYHNRPEEYGLELVPHQAYSYVYPLAEETLADLAYFFESKRDREHSQLPSEALAALAAGRPGLHLAKERVFNWQVRARGSSNEPPPVLTMTDDGEALRIRDTRALATRAEHVLTGLDRQVYLACDHAINAAGVPGALKRHFDRTVTWEEVEPVLDDLVANKLVLDIEARYLSLATWEGRAPAEKAPRFAAVDWTRAVREMAPSSLAATIEPASVSVRELFGA